MQDTYGISSRRITGSPPGAPTCMEFLRVWKSLRVREPLHVWSLYVTGSPYVYGVPMCMELLRVR